MEIYDYLAAVPVIAGAGGAMTDWDGKRADDRFRRPRGRRRRSADAGAGPQTAGREIVGAGARPQSVDISPRTAQIYLHLAPPIVRIGLPNRSDHAGAAGIVHQEVDRPQQSLRLRDHVVDRCPISNVGPDRDGTVMNGAELVQRAVKFVGRSRSDGDGSALARQGEGDRATDAPGTASDERGGPRQAPVFGN